MVRVLVFTMIIVVAIDMWRHSAIGRRKLSRLRLAFTGYWWYWFWKI
jgi:hypothetical protein